MDKKVVLVTGASRGVGRRIAMRLAESNFIVIANYNKSESKAKELEQFGKSCWGFIVLVRIINTPFTLLTITSLGFVEAKPRGSVLSKYTSASALSLLISSFSKYD